MEERILHGEAETRDFAEAFAGGLQAGDVVALVGDLGTGKTTMTKYLARALGVTEEITSPTFTIVKEYHSGRLPLYHFDVYRLTSGQELLDLGLEEYFGGDGVAVVEWADIVTDVLPESAHVIALAYGDREGERKIRWL